MDIKDLSSKQTGVLCLSILVVALCGITYELIIGAVSSYLLGNSVFQFSITIGLFMFAMGLGSFVSKYLNKDLIRTFVIVEILIALIGGVCSLVLFMTFSAAPSLYQPVMYITIILIGGMVGIEIPLLTRILATKRNFKDALAEVFSLDYLGALIGSLIFPLLLLPTLGLVRSSFAIGLLNITVAIINVWIFRHYFKRPSTPLIFSGVVCAILLSAIVTGTMLTLYVEQKLYLDQIVFRHQSPYQRVILTKNHVTDRHRLYIDGHIQFAEQDEHRYHETLVHTVMRHSSPSKRVLILGGGDGMAAREVYKWADVEHVDLVDIDPTITSICSEVDAIRNINEDALIDKRTHLHHMDAFQFVRDATEPYDRIIIDLPDPHNEVLNKLYSREFYGMVRKALTTDGAMICQSSSPFATRRVYWTIRTSMEAAGFNVASLNTAVPSFGLWGFHVCTDSGKPAKLTRPLPENLSYLNDEVMAASFYFAKDISRVETPVNSMLEPSLYQIYNAETKR